MRASDRTVNLSSAKKASARGRPKASIAAARERVHVIGKSGKRAAEHAREGGKERMGRTKSHGWTGGSGGGGCGYITERTSEREVARGCESASEGERERGAPLSRWQHGRRRGCARIEPRPPLPLPLVVGPTRRGRSMSTSSQPRERPRGGGGTNPVRRGGGGGDVLLLLCYTLGDSRGTHLYPRQNMSRAPASQSPASLTHQHG